MQEKRQKTARKEMSGIAEKNKAIRKAAKEAIKQLAVQNGLTKKQRKALYNLTYLEMIDRLSKTD